MNEQVKKLIFLVAAWLFLTALLFSSASRFLPVQTRYTYIGNSLMGPAWLWNRANFEGAHYLEIVRNGYSVSEEAFFPFYPLLVRTIVGFSSHREVMVAVGVSLVSLFLAVYCLFKLFCLDWSPDDSLWMIGLMLIFPTSFFFGAVYAESLFLLLSAVAFYLARTNRWLGAALATAAVTATSPIGIALAAAIFVEWLFVHQKFMVRSVTFKNVGKGLWGMLPVLIMPLGLILYMLFLYRITGGSPAFVNLQPGIGAARSANVVLPYQVAYRYLKMLITVDKLTVTYYVVLLESFSTLLFTALALVGFTRKIRPSYLVYLTLGIIIPSLSGTLTSEPRYLLVLFPAFMVLELILKDRPWFRVPYLALGLLGLILTNLLFGAGFWVA